MWKILLWPLKLLPWRLFSFLVLAAAGGWLAVKMGWMDWSHLLPAPAQAATPPPVPGPDWMGLFNRASVWLMASAALPVVLLPFTLAMLRRCSNGATLALLGIYTALAAALGLWLLWPLTDFWGVFVLALALLLVGGAVEYGLCSLIQWWWLEE